MQVYESVKPTTGTGGLVWHRLGAKTIELIHENVTVEAVQDDLETLVLNAELLEAVLGTPDPTRKAKEIDIKVSNRLRKHVHAPRFKALAERLEALRQKHEQGLLIGPTGTSANTTDGEHCNSLGIRDVPQDPPLRNVLLTYGPL